MFGRGSFGSKGNSCDSLPEAIAIRQVSSVAFSFPFKYHD